MMFPNHAQLIMMQKMNDLKNRFKGALYGLACGDAVGAIAEWKPPEWFLTNKVIGMSDNDNHGMKAGQFTDDTSMALCVAQSLIDCNGVDQLDHMKKFSMWYMQGYMGCNGKCNGIGRTTRLSIENYLTTGQYIASDMNPEKAGNGSIMRLAPLPMFYVYNFSDMIRATVRSTKTTHAAYESIYAAVLFSIYMHRALLGEKKQNIISPVHFLANDKNATSGLKSIIFGEYLQKPYDNIKGTGYVIESLEAALWCFYNTDNYKDAVLMAANMGYDADTTAAIVGQLAGAHYGYDDIPTEWVEVLDMKDTINSIIDRIYNVVNARLTSN